MSSVDFIPIQKLLTEKLLEARTKNPAYSLRAFAKRIGISPSMLSEVLSGKRNAAEDTARKIALRLHLSPEEAQKVLAPYTNRRLGLSHPTSSRAAYTQLSMDQYWVISEWYHFAILSLAETDGFSSAPSWIARRLGIRLQEAKDALSRLERLELLERDSKGRLLPTGAQYATSDEVADVSIRKSHAQDLELARRSLDADEISQRDFVAITMAIDPRRLPSAKKMVREFRDRLCAHLESGKKTEVYKMCMNLFPLTKLEEGELK